MPRACAATSRAGAELLAARPFVIEFSGPGIEWAAVSAALINGAIAGHAPGCATVTKEGACCLLFRRERAPSTSPRRSSSPDSPTSSAPLWPTNDHFATQIADTFYRHLTNSQGTPDISRTAHALHQTLRDLRDQLPLTPSWWAAHLQAGA